MLTKEDVAAMWLRDRGYAMICPVIARVDKTKAWDAANCVFTESLRKKEKKDKALKKVCDRCGAIIVAEQFPPVNIYCKKCGIVMRWPKIKPAKAPKLLMG